jgi:hypothetical protein
MDSSNERHSETPEHSDICEGKCTPSYSQLDRTDSIHTLRRRSDAHKRVVAYMLRPFVSLLFEMNT